MSNITWTHRADYPRHLATSGRKTEITGWTNSTSSWKTIWDNTILPSCASWAAESDTTTFNRGDSADEVIYLLGLAGWIEGTASYHNKLLSYGKWLNANRSNWLSWSSTERRDQCMSLAFCYDWLRTGIITFSAGDRALIGDGVADISDGAPHNANEYIDGHSHGDQAAALVAGLAIAGESGSGYDFTTVAATRINTCFDFWFGTGGTLNPSRIQTMRYLCAQGLPILGGWYGATELWAAALVLMSMETGLVQNDETAHALQLLGEDYDPMTDETWVPNAGEYAIWGWLRGDYQYWQNGHDCYRQGSTVQMRYNQRMALSFLIHQGGPYSTMVRWARDTLHAAALAAGQVSSYHYAYEVPSINLADRSDAPSTVEGLAKTKYFSVPGSFWHRNTWDIPSSCVIQVESRDRYITGHSHLDRGAIQVSVKNDMVLTASGIYISGGGDSNDYGGNHHRKYYQQTIAKSGVPCFPASDITHTALLDGVRGPCPHGGGQLYRKWYNGSTWKYDADNVSLLQNDGGGLAWKVATSGCVDPLSTTCSLLYMDVTKAYERSMDDAGTTYARVSLCEIKDLVIKGEWTWPIVLRYVRAQMAPGRNTLGAFVPWHGRTQWSESWPHGSTPQTGDTRRFKSSGYRGTGKCLLDLYNWQNFTIRHVGNGPLNSYGYGSQQFYYDGENFSPDGVASTNYQPDMGVWRVEMACASSGTEVYWLVLILPMAIADEPPAYTWVDVPSWFGVRFGSTAHEYRVHKTLNQYMTGGDSTPPGAPTDVQAIAGDARVTVRCTPNPEDDMYPSGHYHIKYREKV